MKIYNLSFNQSGQSLVLAIIALGVIITGVVAVFAGSLTLKQNSRYTLDSLDATNLAEAGVDKAVASLNKTAGQYSGESETQLGNGSYAVQITPLDSNTLKITSTGYVPNSQSPKSKKTVSLNIQRGDGMSFAYGIQAGEGGFIMTGGSRVNGSVYSNSDIKLSGGSTITGDAFVAGGTQPTADQQLDCSTCADFLFGKIVAGNNILDVAQSFKPSTTATLNKVSLKLKKIGSPANATVRILTDGGNKPSKTSLTYGTLNANLVSSQYGFVDVGFISNPILTANTPYWIVIDTSSDVNNYWSWQLDSLSGYTQTISRPAWSPNWQANGNPSWTGIDGDFTFKTFMGGKINKLVGEGSSYVNGSGYANTMTANNSSALQIAQEAYYQTEGGITVHGSSCTNNSHCHPASPDSQPLVMPVSDSNIQEWKQLASTPVYNGNLTVGWPCNPLTAKKYVGNLVIQGGCAMQIDTPIWITGNLTVQSGASLSLKSSYGASSGIIVVDGITVLSGGSVLRGSGTAGSYMMVISTNTSTSSPYAIEISGGNSSSILYAPYGGIHLSGGSNFREASAYQIFMDGGAILTYETGVASPFFSSGPSGSFSVVKGTYQGQ